MRTFNFRLPCASQKRMCLSSLMSSSRSGNMISLLKRSENLENVSVLKYIYSYTQTAQISREFPYLAGKHRFLTDELICKIIFNNRSSSSKVKWLNNSAVMSFTRKMHAHTSFPCVQTQTRRTGSSAWSRGLLVSVPGKFEAQNNNKDNTRKRTEKTAKNWKKFFFRLSSSSSAGYLEFFSMSHISWIVTRREKSFLYSISELKIHH